MNPNIYNQHNLEDYDILEPRPKEEVLVSRERELTPSDMGDFKGSWNQNNSRAV